VEQHKVDHCENCNKNLKDQVADFIERRQVYDIPEIKIGVTEHQSEVKNCSCGCLNKAFPKGVDYKVQYGPNIKSTVVYLQDYQLLPYERTKELIKDLFCHSISKGSLYNFREKAFYKLESFEEKLKTLLCLSLVLGFDETGFRINKKRWWLHSSSTDRHVYYAVHQKRGQFAMNDIGILPFFKGIAVHDFWKSYYRYDCEHSLCNAHLLRDLVFIKERFEQKWAEELISLLVKLLDLKNKALARGQEAISKITLKKYALQYDQLIKKGLNQNPYKPPLVKKRGKKKKSPPLNLLERFRDYKADILRFFYDFKVPFDNNFSERDIRMMKVKQKISGCFRSVKGAKLFARTRSYIMTARKQNVNVMEALRSLFTDNAVAHGLVVA
jgi:transposase